MKLVKIIIPTFVFIIACVSCAILKPVNIIHSASLLDYKYVYIAPTSELTSSSGTIYGGSSGVYGTTQTKSVNPSDIIAGNLLKRGYVRLTELRPELNEETIIINYGESGRRNIMGGLCGYTIEVTIQLLSAKTCEQICIVTAEGQGSTEADDIRIAINRCLDTIFESAD